MNRGKYIYKIMPLILLVGLLGVYLLDDSDIPEDLAMVEEEPLTAAEEIGIYFPLSYDYFTMEYTSIEEFAQYLRAFYLDADAAGKGILEDEYTERLLEQCRFEEEGLEEYLESWCGYLDFLSTQDIWEYDETGYSKPFLNEQNIYNRYRGYIDHDENENQAFRFAMKIYDLWNPEALSQDYPDYIASFYYQDGKLPPDDRYREELELIAALLQYAPNGEEHVKLVKKAQKDLEKSIEAEYERIEHMTDWMNDLEEEDDSDSSESASKKATSKKSDKDTSKKADEKPQKKYDPYDVYDYDDADDFADEWADEFGDGDYDEGWDDAFMYWEDHH